MYSLNAKKVNLKNSIQYALYHVYIKQVSIQYIIIYYVLYNLKNCSCIFNFSLLIHNKLRITYILLYYI